MSQEKRPVATLAKPELDVVFKPNKDGTFSITIPVSKSNSDAEIPMLRYIEKNMENLKGTLENVLVTKGVPHSISNIPVEFHGEVSGKVGGSGQLGGETSEVERVTVGSVKGGLAGETEISGKIGGSIKFELQPGKPGLDENTQAQMQKLLDEKVDALCMRWAENNRNGTSVPAADGTKLTISPEVVQQYIDTHSQSVKVPSIDDIMKGVIKAMPFQHSNTADTPTVAAASELASPDHSFHRMYTDATSTLEGMARTNGASPETLAAALTLAAANAGFDPAKPVQITPGRQENTFFAVQGDPESPASKSVMVNAATATPPTAEQIALMPTGGDALQAVTSERSGPTRA